MTKERKKRKKMSGKREKCVKKKKRREREKNGRNKWEERKKCSKTRTETEILTCLVKKVSLFCRTHIAIGHRILGGRPGPHRLPSAAATS